MLQKNLISSVWLPDTVTLMLTVRAVTLWIMDSFIAWIEWGKRLYCGQKNPKKASCNDVKATMEQTHSEWGASCFTEEKPLIWLTQCVDVCAAEAVKHRSVWPSSRSSPRWYFIKHLLLSAVAVIFILCYLSPPLKSCLPRLMFTPITSASCVCSCTDTGEQMFRLLFRCLTNERLNVFPWVGTSAAAHLSPRSSSLLFFSPSHLLLSSHMDIC